MSLTVNECIPTVGIELTELVSPARFEGLADLDIDLGLERPPIPGQFESVMVHPEDLELAVPAGHPLAAQDKRVALADVVEGYIGYSPEGSRYLHDIWAAMIAWTAMSSASWHPRRGWSSSPTSVLEADAPLEQVSLGRRALRGLARLRCA